MKRGIYVTVDRSLHEWLKNDFCPKNDMNIRQVYNELLRGLKSGKIKLSTKLTTEGSK